MMHYAVYVQFLMAWPDRWESLDEFYDTPSAESWVEKRQALTHLTYRLVRHDGIVIKEIPFVKPDLSE